MVECDCCQVWFHGECVDAKKSTIETTEKFMCPSCSHTAGVAYLFDRKPVSSSQLIQARVVVEQLIRHFIDFTLVQVPLAQRPTPRQVLEWLKDAETLKVSLYSIRKILMVAGLCGQQHHDDQFGRLSRTRLFCFSKPCPWACYCQIRILKTLHRASLDPLAYRRRQCAAHPSAAKAPVLSTGSPLGTRYLTSCGCG